MRKQILLLLAGASFWNATAQTKTNDFKPEIEKWKTELLLNGEVGPACIEDYHKWAEKNPDYYWGMQAIQSKTFDMNADGVKDGLFYFPAVNCVGGNGQGSDFALLVYSHKGNYLTNKSITKSIEEKIMFHFSEKGLYDLSNTVIHYEQFSNTIKGNFSTWRNEDAHCCPSLSGTFEYNPVNFKITTKVEDKLKK